jgi:hypothetical protein
MNANADNNVIESGGSPNESVSNERDMDKAPGSIRAKAEEIASCYTADERAMACTIYGEAGGLPYADRLGVGWSMRTYHDLHPGQSYEDQADMRYVPRDSLRKDRKSGEYTSIELKAWEDSFKAAGEVLNASPGSNPIPGVTHFYDITRKTNPWPSATQVPYGSGTLLYFRDVP